MEELMATIAQFQRDVEKTFEKIWTKLATERPLKLGAWEPPADVIDKDNEIIVYVDVPGYSKDDVKVRVTDDTVEVMAERKVEAVTGGKYILKQRVREVLYKRIDLPIKVRPEQAKAKMENGVLEIKIPKSETTREVQIVVE